MNATRDSREVRRHEREQQSDKSRAEHDRNHAELQAEQCDGGGDADEGRHPVDAAARPPRPELAGFSLFAFLRYIREELLIVLGTCSSESALPRLMEKLERLGRQKSVVGLVVPAGYSFNLDGSCINMKVLAIFIAQATDTSLSPGQQVTLLFVMLLTSKGAASVSGGAFIVLAATLGTAPGFPVAGLVLVLGVYRFISEGGALVNVIGNGIAILVVAKWDRALDAHRLLDELFGKHSKSSQFPNDSLTFGRGE